MKLERSAVSVIVLAVVASSQANWGPIAGEAGAGLVGGLLVGAGLSVVGGGIGMLVEHPRYFGDPPGAVALVGMGVGGLAGVSLGTTIGTCLVGRACRQEGKAKPTFYGALAGTVVGVPLVLLGSMTRIGPGLVPIGVLLPATGAVIGYNLSRPKRVTGGSLFNRVGLPELSLERTGVADSSTVTAMNIRLVTVRF